MVKLICLIFLAIFSISYASNLRVDHRYLINDGLVRNQRSKTATYPVRENEISDSQLKNYISNLSEPTFLSLGDSVNNISLHGRAGAKGGIVADTLSMWGMYYDINVRGKFRDLEFDLCARNMYDKYDKEVIRDWSKLHYTGPYYNTDSKDDSKYTNRKLWDQNRFNVVLPFKGGAIEAGHGKISIGPSLFDNLLIGDFTNDLDYYRGDYTFGYFTFSLGMMGLMTDHFLEQKKMAYHRLDFNNSFLNVGLYEGVIFKDRTPLMYAIPVVPFIFSEHYYGDMDNNNMGIDITGYIKNFKVYGNFFIDDMYSPTSFFDDSWWGNKWATTIGASYTTKIGKKGYYVLGASEYTRVMPWVYTHHLDSGILRYTHYGKELGVEHGSDSDRINAMIEYGRIGKFSMNATVKKTRKGPVNTFRIHDSEIDGTDREFLEELVENKLEYSYQLKAYFSVFNFNFAPKFLMGGDDDKFFKDFQFGIDIMY